MKIPTLPIEYNIGDDGRYYILPNKDNCIVVDDCYLSGDRVTFVIYRNPDNKIIEEVTENNNLRDIQILADIDSAIATLCEAVRSLTLSDINECKYVNGLSFLVIARNNLKSFNSSCGANVNKYVYETLKPIFEKNIGNN